MNRDELVQQLSKENDAWNTMGLIQGIGALALGLGVGVVYFLSPADKQYLVSGIGLTANHVIMAIVSLGVSLVGVNLIRQWRASAASQRPTLRALREDPGRIVWVYHVAIYRSGVHTQTEIWMGLNDGQLEGIMSSRDPGERYLAALREVCPHATHGYSEAIVAQFAKAPASLALT
jgi:hypothetical protein